MCIFLLVDDIILICSGKVLEDERLLSEYGIQDGWTVNVVRSLRGGGDVTQELGERAGRNASKEQLYGFDATETEESRSCCIF